MGAGGKRTGKAGDVGVKVSLRAAVPGQRCLAEASGKEPLQGGLGLCGFPASAAGSIWIPGLHCLLTFSSLTSIIFKFLF